MTAQNGQNSSDSGECAAPTPAASVLAAVQDTLRGLSDRARCPGRCTRLSHERGGGVYARHLLACLDCPRVWTIVCEFSVSRAA